MFAAGTAPSLLAKTVSVTGIPGPRRRVLVVVFQRGAVDGLSMVIPFGDPNYYRLRPSLAIPKPDGTTGSAVNLDGFFGLHPALAPLKPVWDARHLAIVEATGSPDPTRSHFDAQRFLFTGTSGRWSTGDGFLDRLLTAGAIECTEDPCPPDTAARYPASTFGRNLAHIARLIKADTGLEIGFTEIDGWDTHVNQADQLSNRLAEFGQGLAAFYQDLGDRIADTTVVTMSEFGRTARENEDRGTDHGHGNVMLVMGGNVRGGRVYGDWPGLAREQLYEGQDLHVTTDFRDVLSELVTRHLGSTNVETIFPGYNPQFRNFV